jgi:hypothetical protein
MGAPRLSHVRPALARGAPAILEPECPRRRHVFQGGPARAVLAPPPGPAPSRGRASAKRARSGPKAGAQRDAEPGARPAERSAAGLDEVEKFVTTGFAFAQASAPCWSVGGKPTGEAVAAQALVRVHDVVRGGLAA